MTKAPTMQGEAVTLEWPERGIALATMTRADAMNTLSLELLDELGKVNAARARTGADHHWLGPRVLLRRSPQIFRGPGFADRHDARGYPR